MRTHPLVFISFLLTWMVDGVPIDEGNSKYNVLECLLRPCGSLYRRCEPLLAEGVGGGGGCIECFSRPLYCLGEHRKELKDDLDPVKQW